MGGDPPQAAPDGLLPNDLDEPPSSIGARVDAAVDRALAVASQNGRHRTRPLPNRLGSISNNRAMTREERDNELLSIGILFYIRDLTQDLIFPPPARVATVMLTEILLYRRPSLRPTEWYVGPRVTVQTVVRSQATDWLMQELDTTVTRILSPFIGQAQN